MGFDKGDSDAASKISKCGDLPTQIETESKATLKDGLSCFCGKILMQCLNRCSTRKRRTKVRFVWLWSWHYGLRCCRHARAYGGDARWRLVFDISGFRGDQSIIAMIVLACFLLLAMLDLALTACPAYPNIFPIKANEITQVS